MKKLTRTNRRAVVFTVMSIFTLLFIIYTPITSAQQPVQANDRYFDEGFKLYKEGRYQEAISELQKSNTFTGETAKAYAGIGVCYVLLKQYDEAIQNLQRAITLDPRIFTGYFQLGVAFGNTGQHKKR